MNATSDKMNGATESLHLPAAPIHNRLLTKGQVMAISQSTGAQPEVQITADEPFGRLIVSGVPFHINRHGNKAVVCKCKCGTISVVRIAHLKSGATSSCGCLNNEKRAERMTTHGASGTSLYIRWRSMIQRCENANHDFFDSYGGRGISVCEDWHRFETFREWAIVNGFSESLELDRREVNGNYEPRNCRWVTQLVNSRNKRTTILITALGESKTIAEWVTDIRCMVREKTLRKRIRLGWDHETSITKTAR